MIKEIAYLVLDLFRIRILGCDNYFGALFSDLLMDIVYTLIKQVVGL